MASPGASATRSSPPTPAALMMPSWRFDFYQRPGKIRTVRLLIAAAAVVLVTAASAVDGQCDSQDDPRCLDRQAIGGGEKPDPIAEGDLPLKVNGIGIIGLVLVGTMFVGVFVWIAATCKFAYDGSLPARMALWGLLPEAYAAISVSSVVALLRLKQRPTPVIVLRQCVTDENAKELADAIQLYAKQACIEALELPHNPKLGEEGIRKLVQAATAENIILQDLDFSFNPHLDGCVVDILEPVLRRKTSKITLLRLAECGLNYGHIGKLADMGQRCGIRTLDLSYNDLSGSGENLASLLEFPILEELNLTDCKLQLADVEEIAGSLPYTSLKALQIGANKLDVDALNAICKHLPSCCVDELGLEFNCFEAKDLAVLGVAWAKRPFARIRLNGNKMSQEEVANFVKTLKSMHS